MADQLAWPDRFKLLKHLAETPASNHNRQFAPQLQSLRGMWRNARAADNLDETLSEIRHEWEKEWAGDEFIG